MTHTRSGALPYLDKSDPGAWKSASAFATVVSEHALKRGLTAADNELIKLRVSQLNGCLACLDLHSRLARRAGVPQQKLDVLPTWRCTALFTEREAAILSVAEAATVLPLTTSGKADLTSALGVLGDEAFVAAEWVASTMNVFNRISILSEHQIRARDADGRPL